MDAALHSGSIISPFSPIITACETVSIACSVVIKNLVADGSVTVSGSFLNLCPFHTSTTFPDWVWA